MNNSLKAFIISFLIHISLFAVILNYETPKPEKKEIISFELYDTTGKLVISNKYLDFNSEISISTSNLSTGLYIVKIKTIDGLITNDKIIIN